MSRPAEPLSPVAEPAADLARRGLSRAARGLVGSEILKIAAEIRALQASGSTICNLTVGDFARTEFRIPQALEAYVSEALAAGETCYPPSDGMRELRVEIGRLYERAFATSYPLDSILVTAGARPAIYATFQTILDPGEKVLYPVPSWNNNHYVSLARAEAIELVVGPDTNFLPTAEAIAPRLAGVRLICINSPLNPTGTLLDEREVRAIADLVVDENRRRAAAGERALFVMWDQVYWMLTFGTARHHAPTTLVPESAAWTIYVDGISKSLAATGLRVGWAVAPPWVAAPMRDFLGHVGAWAPRPEQVATARLLADPAPLEAFHTRMLGEVERRLSMLHDGFAAMAMDGHPVATVPPQGAIYLSARFDLIGRNYQGTKLASNEQIRNLLLAKAGFAVVPFQAFGLREDTGWMRLSVGAVSPAEIASGLARVRALLECLA